MRRPLALLAAIIAMTAVPAGAHEPLDVDLAKLGPPTQEVWLAQLGCLTPTANTCSPQQVADAAAMAGDARVRFGRLATDLAMAFTSSLLEPASTTGYNGFQLGFEVGYVGVSAESLGGTTASFPAATYGGARPYWATASEQPSSLMVPSVHVRKGLPYSFEVGGRFSYLSQSSYFAAQLEGKWAFVEGYKKYPDAAVRVAWTKVLGPDDLDLSTREIDLLASKRFGVSPVMSLTPYLAFRFTWLDASTKPLAFAPDYTATTPPTPTPGTPAELALTTAGFPTVSSRLYRTTAGVRMTTYAVSMALELTYLGSSSQGKDAPGATDTPKYTVPASLSGAFTFGFEF